MLRKSPERRLADDKQIQGILDLVDQQERTSPQQNRRVHPRHSYRQGHIPARITQPAGGMIDTGVAGRELSAGGMSFLYRGFLHAGTDMRLNLIRRAGGHELVDSTVVWCRHIVGQYHLVGVKFRQCIYPQLFVESANSPADEASHVDPSQLTGSVLHIDDQELDRMLFEHQMTPTPMTVTPAENVESALAAARQIPFDLIVCDLNLGSARGEDVIRLLRAQGYKSPIIALTAETSEARLEAAQAAGARSVLLKPYEPQALMAVIADVLSAAGNDDTDEPIYSTMAGNPGADELIGQCINKVRTIAAELHRAIAAGELSRVRTLAQTLKGSGNGFGFAALTSAAKLAVDTLDASTTIKGSTDELRRLESICNRLAPGKDPKAK